MDTKRYDGPSVVVGVVPSGLLQEGRPAWLVAVLDVDGIWLVWLWAHPGVGWNAAAALEESRPLDADGRALAKVVSARFWDAVGHAGTGGRVWGCRGRETLLAVRQWATDRTTGDLRDPCTWELPDVPGTSREVTS